MNRSSIGGEGRDIVGWQASTAKTLEYVQTLSTGGTKRNRCDGKIWYVKEWGQGPPRPMWSLFCKGPTDALDGVTWFATVLDFLWHVRDRLEKWEVSKGKTG